MGSLFTGNGGHACPSSDVSPCPGLGGSSTVTAVRQKMAWHLGGQSSVPGALPQHVPETALPYRLASLSPETPANQWHSDCQASAPTRTDVTNKSEHFPKGSSYHYLGGLLPGARGSAQIIRASELLGARATQSQREAARQFARGLERPAVQRGLTATGHVTSFF